MARKKKTTETGSCFVIEIGLDSDVAPRFDGTYPYLMSLVKVDNFDKSANPVPAWFTQLNIHDRFVFRVFNYSVTEELGLPDIVVKGLFARFLAPENPKAAALCTDEDMICTGKDYYPDPGPGTPSQVMPGATGWRFLNEKGEEKPFEITVSKKRARLHVSVAATFPGVEKELRMYTHDPEIFVGEGGPPPHRHHSRSLKRR